MKIELEVGNRVSVFRMSKRDANRFENAVYGLLTANVPGAQYTWDFKKGVWDGTTTLASKTTNDGYTFIYEIPTGLLPHILDRIGSHITHIDDRRGLTTPQLSTPNMNLRQYQTDAIYAAFQHTLSPLGWWPRGILRVATGGGKTEMAVAMYEMYKVPTVFLVHRKDLLLQAAERFKKYGYGTGVIGDSKYSIDNITIATMQTLNKIIYTSDDCRREDTLDMINACEQLFLDECHLMASSLDKGNMFCDIVNWFEYTPVRWGLTATPFMRSKYDNMLLEGVAGGLLCDISNDDLIGLGYLTPPKIKMLDVPGTLKVSRPDSGRNKAGAMWRAIFDKGIKFNSVRNNLVADELLANDGPTLCLVTTVEQGEFIQAIVTNRGLHPPELLTGKATSNERRQVVKDLQSGKINAIICTTIFDEGVDIPELRKVILASGGKSQVKLLQRIGRLLRLAKGKTTATVVDFNDMHHPKLREHARERLKRYREEGFEIA